MKQYEYGLIAVLPPILILTLCYIVTMVKVRDLFHIARWIAKNVFSDTLKEKKKKEDEHPRWLFNDIDLTCEARTLSRILATSLMLFAGMLAGTFVLFWQLLLLEMSSDCDVADSSKDCFEVKFWGWPKQDPVDCNSPAIQNGAKHVYCYKIVFNFGVATGASYGVFKLSTLAFSLGSSALLTINNEKSKILLAFRVTVVLLGVLVMVIPSVLMATPFGVALLSTNLAAMLQTLIVAFNLAFFLWGIPWNKLIALKVTKKNSKDIGLENPVAVTDDEEA